MSLIKFVCDVPNEFEEILKSESENLTSDSNNKKRFYRSFGISLSKQYPVSKYSTTNYGRDSIERTNAVLYWIKSIYPNHELIQMQINSMDPGQIYPVHVDTRLFHQYAIRLHIGIKNNQNCEYIEFFKSNGCWRKKIYNIENFKLYEFDNRIPHSVHNKNQSSRVNIIIDVIEKKLLDSRDDWKKIEEDKVKRMEDIEKEFIQIPELYIYTLNNLKQRLLNNGLN